MQERVFVYGSLMFPTVRNAVLQQACPVRPAVLFDFERRTVLLQPDGDGNFPAIVPQPGSVVEGVLVEALSRDQLTLLDVFEDTESQSYIRQRTKVVCKNEKVVAWTYVCGPNLVDKLGGEWCPKSFEANELDKFCQIFLN